MDRKRHPESLAIEMVADDDRREHVRSAFERNAICYVDGARVDGRTIDISRGGARLETSTPDAFAIGETVGVVFGVRDGAPRSVLVFGTVVRHDAGEKTRVGVAWTRAVGRGTAEELTSFLQAAMGLTIPRVSIRVEYVGVEKLPRSTYVFSRAVEITGPGAAPRRVLAPPSARGRHASVAAVTPFAAPSAAATTTASFDPGSAPVASAMAGATAGATAGAPETAALPAADPDAGRKSKKATQRVVYGVKASLDPEPGAITGIVSRADLTVDCGLDATLVVAEGELAVRVTRIGMDSMFVQSGFVPLDHKRPVCLRLTIPSREGAINLECTGRLARLSAPTAKQGGGFELVIVDVDEGDRPGILTRYVRWLQFVELSEE